MVDETCRKCTDTPVTLADMAKAAGMRMVDGQDNDYNAIENPVGTSTARPSGQGTIGGLRPQQTNRNLRDTIQNGPHISVGTEGGTTILFATS